MCRVLYLYSGDGDTNITAKYMPSRRERDTSTDSDIDVSETPPRTPTSVDVFLQSLIDYHSTCGPGYSAYDNICFRSWVSY